MFEVAIGWGAFSVGAALGIWLGIQGIATHPGRMFRHKATGEVVFLNAIAKQGAEWVCVYKAGDGSLLAAESRRFFESFEDQHVAW